MKTLVEQAIRPVTLELIREQAAEIEQLRAALRKIRTGIDTGQITAERAANIAELALRDAGTSEQKVDGK